MGEKEYQMFGDNNSFSLYHGDHKSSKKVEEVYVDEEDDVISTISSIDSTISNGSSLLDMGDDASSSSNSCSSSLDDLSELMSHLPIKRGLSKFYQGKSESFTSLARVTSIEDLAKKQTPYKIKSSKSYGGGLDTNFTRPKSSITKKNKSKGFVITSSCNNLSRRSSFVTSNRPPLMPNSQRSFGC